MGTPNDPVVPGSKSSSVGVAVTQDITGNNCELFMLFRRYHYSDRLTEYQTSFATSFGMRWKF